MAGYLLLNRAEIVIVFVSQLTLFVPALLVAVKPPWLFFPDDAACNADGACCYLLLLSQTDKINSLLEPSDYYLTLSFYPHHSGLLFHRRVTKTENGRRKRGLILHCIPSFSRQWPLLWFCLVIHPHTKPPRLVFRCKESGCCYQNSDCNSGWLAGVSHSTHVIKYGNPHCFKLQIQITFF